MIKVRSSVIWAVRTVKTRSRKIKTSEGHFVGNDSLEIPDVRKTVCPSKFGLLACCNEAGPM